MMRHPRKLLLSGGLKIPHSLDRQAVGMANANIKIMISVFIFISLMR